MASKASPRRRKAGTPTSTVTRMCSINATGVVFVNTTPLEVSSELTLTIQTTMLGAIREWTVRGWVVECSRQEPDYQVTLLFSHLPEGLQQVLKLTSGRSRMACPRMSDGSIFGLN